MHLAEFHPLPSGAEQYTLEFMENRQLIKLQETAELVTIGFTGEADVLLEGEMAFFHKKPVRFVQIPAPELTEYLSRQLSDFQGEARQEVDEKTLLDQLANDAPIVNLVNNILLEGIRIGCSDIHIESFETGVVVRYRVDGVLRVSRRLSRDVFAGVSSRLKVMSDLNIIERRMPQDGRLSVSLSGKDVEFRVSIVPINEGESIVLRLFNKHGANQSLESLGFAPDYLASLRRLGKMPNGLVLVTGPTGSGKTTTLNALIRELHSDEIKIITVEDPVENVVNGVNQVQTNEAIGLTFESILRRLLRQDPDILMVGEIRDKKTAELALRSALTGHLVLSTLHTNDALSAIPRLLNMGLEPYLLAGILRGVSAQRLIRKVCPHCSQAQKPDKSEAAFLKRHGLDGFVPLRGAGCAACHQTGYSGRLAIGEIFEMDEQCEDFIIHEKKKSDFASYFEKQKQRFLLEDGLLRLKEGLTTIQELERAVLM